jgi:hypothetical protein
LGHAAIEVNDVNEENADCGCVVIAAAATSQTHSRSGPVFTKDGTWFCRKSMNAADKYDVVVPGGGAGGKLMARALAQE